MSKVWIITYETIDQEIARARVSARDENEARATFATSHRGVKLNHVHRWFHDIDEIRQANRAAGGNWFSPDTMRWFRCRVHDAVYSGRFFVTSERNPESVRAYTVREVTSDGNVHTAPGHEFFEYASRSGAHAAARRAATAPPCCTNHDRHLSTGETL